VTLSQIIDVYHHLHSNDEMYEPETIRLELIVRSKPSVRLTRLFKAAEDGKGFVAISSDRSLDEYEDKVSDDAAASNEENEEEYTEEWNEDTGEEYAEEWNDENDDENQVEHVDDVAVEGNETAHNLKEPSPSNKSDADEGEELALPTDFGGALEEQDNFPSALLLSEDPVAQPDNEESETTKAPEVSEDQEDFDADDLIDYSEDDDDTARPTRSPTIQPDQSANIGKPQRGFYANDYMLIKIAVASSVLNDDANSPPQIPEALESETAEDNVADDDFIIDFGNTDDPAIEQNIAQSPPDTFVGNTVEDAPELVADTDDFLNLELDFESTGNVDSADNHDGVVDYNLDEPGISGDSKPEDTAKSYSPSGKRTWDEHAGDSSIPASEQGTMTTTLIHYDILANFRLDPKRVRSNG
jgi:hypothetical protein